LRDFTEAALPFDSNGKREENGDALHRKCSEIDRQTITKQALTRFRTRRDREKGYSVFH
jgi:hypothetical protein